MKLVEIKDIREGQIYERNRCIFVVMRRSGIDRVVLRLYCYNRKSEPNNAYEAQAMHEVRIDALNDCQLIGKLGITHRIEGNRLVELPREDLIVDDVVKYLDFDGFTVRAVICAVITALTVEETQYAFITETGESEDTTLFEKEEIGEDSGIFTYTPKKIGILGVTHEFINSREQSNDD